MDVVQDCIKSNLSCPLFSYLAPYRCRFSHRFIKVCQNNKTVTFNLHPIQTNISTPLQLEKRVDMLGRKTFQLVREICFLLSLHVNLAANTCVLSYLSNVMLISHFTFITTPGHSSKPPLNVVSGGTALLWLPQERFTRYQSLSFLPVETSVCSGLFCC